MRVSLLVNVLISTIVLVRATQGQPREISFQHLSLDQGLSQVSVYSIVQDQGGFMWFGTEDGLNRYDGYATTVYYHNPSDSNSLSESTPISLLSDRQGNLWIGTYSAGLNLFDPRHSRFVRFTHDPRDSTTISHNRIFAMYEDTRGNFWIGTGSGLNLFDRQTRRCIRYTYNPQDTNSLIHNSIRSICEDTSGRLWIGTASGITVFDRSKNRFIRFRHNPRDRFSLSDDRIMRTFRDRRGRIWIATWGGGLNRFDEAGNRFHRYQHSENPSSISDDVVLSVLEDSRGMFWVGTSHGLNTLDPETGRFDRYYTDLKRPGALRDDNIRFLHEDQAGIVWIGTLRAGVQYYNPHRRKFAHYRKIEGITNSLSSNIVWSFFEDPGGVLWIGTIGGGLNRHDRRAHQFTHFTHVPGNPFGLADNEVKALLGEDSHTMWVGTNEALHRFDPVAQKFTRFSHDPQNSLSLGEGVVSALCKDRSGNLWVGTRGGGLNLLDRKTNSFTRFTHSEDESASISDNDVWAIYEDGTGVLWIATDGGGVNAFDTGTRKFTRFRNDPAVPSSISSDAVTTVTEDRDGVLWFGTDRGLNRFDRKSNTFDHFTVADGLPNNFIYGCLADDKSNLWISTNRGLCKFDTRQRTFRSYDPRDGIQSNEFNLSSCFKSKSGEMFFGGVNGFNAFHPDSITDNPHTPPVVINSIKVFNVVANLGQSHETTTDITLSYNQNFFSFEFAALDFTIPEKNQYKYILEGVDENWVQAGTRRYAGYTYIDPGEYLFKVRGSNNDGVWNDEGASIRVVITPPYWQTWWFRVGAAVLIVVIGYSAYRYRINRLMEMHRMRLRIAGDLHDEIGSNLSTIVVASDMIGRRAKLEEHDRSQLNDIARTALQTANGMREIVWFINPEHDRMDDLLLRMKDVAIAMLGDVSYAFHSPDAVPDIHLTPEVRRNIFLVFKEALNNIVRHARATHVDIDIRVEGGMFRMKISDDGVGFDRETIKRGEGLNNLQKRTSAIGAELTIESTPGKGSSTLLTARTSHLVRSRP